MHLILDNNVPDSVAEVFTSRGHTVAFVRNILPADSPDQLVAAVSDQNEAILVSCDRDFKRIAPRIHRGSKTRFKRLSRISIECGEPQAAQRVAAAMSLIESEYEIAQKRHDKRMIIIIQRNGIKTQR